MDSTSCIQSRQNSNFLCRRCKNFIKCWYFSFNVANALESRILLQPHAHVPHRSPSLPPCRTSDLSNIANPSKTHLTLKFPKTGFSIATFIVDKSFWNFAQHMAVKLLCSVQNFRMICQLKWMLWLNEISSGVTLIRSARLFRVPAYTLHPASAGDKVHLACFNLIKWSSHQAGYHGTREISQSQEDPLQGLLLLMLNPPLAIL